MSTTQQQIISNLKALGFTTANAESMLMQIAQGVGIPIDNTIQEIANSQAYILNILTTKNYGKAGYYVSAAQAFQYGYNLSANPTTGLPQYTVIDPSAQIITQAAFEEIIQGNSSQLFLKIASLNAVSGLLQPLTAAQLSAFTSYFTQWQLPGVPVTIINNQPDQLGFTATCTFYNTYDESILQGLIAAALTQFQNTFVFDGEFFAGDLNEWMKGLNPSFSGVPGVRDFSLNNTTLNGTAFNGTTTLPAGYFNFVSGITSNITYNPISG